MLVFILEPKEELYLAKVFIHGVRSVWMGGWLHLMAEEEMQTQKATCRQRPGVQRYGHRPASDRGRPVLSPQCLDLRSLGCKAARQ